MSGISIPELVRQVGLEELDTIGREELATDFMPAAVTGLADGDIITMHAPYTGKHAELYGEGHYGDGLVAKAMARAAIANGMVPGAIYDFQTFAADYFTQPGSLFADRRTESTVRVYPEAVTIDGNPMALDRKPSLVMDYGACLTGRSYIADQIGFLDKGQRPFTYSPLTRLHFTNQSLINTYDAKFGPGTAEAVIENHFYIGREDGIAAATDEVIRELRTHGEPVEVADVILALGARHAAPADMKRGIENAQTLLREGGMLVLRSLARPAVDELGTEEIAGWAFDAGFQEKNAIYYEADLDQVGVLMRSGHFGEREIKTVVLTK